MPCTGDASLFTRSDEIEESLAIDRSGGPELGSRRPGRPALAIYERGSRGPVEADQFLARDGRTWRPGCGEH